MPANVLADAGFLVALLDRRDGHHHWARAQAASFGPPWRTCEAVLTETFYLLGPDDTGPVISLLRRADALVSFKFGEEQESVLALMEKYADVPMSLADACLVRMTETHPDPIVLTTDADFRIYRRHSRQVVPCVMPP
jgi:predicted nucleic acid-binding protein